MSTDLSERLIDVAAAMTRSVTMVGAVADGMDNRQLWDDTRGPRCTPISFWRVPTYPQYKGRGRRPPCHGSSQTPFCGPARRVPASGLQRNEAGGGTQTPLSLGPLYTARGQVLLASFCLFVQRMTSESFLTTEERKIFDLCMIAINRIKCVVYLVTIDEIKN